MNENKVRDNESLDIKFKDKKKDKKNKPKDGSFDLLSSAGDDYLNKLSGENEAIKESEEKDVDALLDTHEFDLSIDLNNTDTVTLDSNDEKNTSTIETKVVNDDSRKLSDEKNSSSEKKDTKDLNSIFEIVNNNVKEATNLFNKNIEMKRKIEEQLDALRKDKEEHEAKKNADYQKIKTYKQEVYDKLKAKKEEVESEIASLKETQIKIINEKNKFEKYKREELTRLKEQEAKNQIILEEEKAKLEEEKNKLKVEKNSLEEAKHSLELDRIKYENDKNELANNLMKFNELVGDFTVGIDRFNLDDN